MTSESGSDGCFTCTLAGFLLTCVVIYVSFHYLFVKSPSFLRDHKRNILDPIGGTAIKNLVANLMATIAIYRENKKAAETNDKELEAFHHAEDHQFFNESHYYNGCDKRNGDRIITRISRRSNKGKLSYVFLLLDLGEKGQYALEKDFVPVDFTKDYPSCLGLSYQCIEPMKKWKMIYKGKMTKGYFNPRDLKNEAFLKKVEMVDVEFELEYETKSPVFWYMRDDNKDCLAKNLSQEPWGYYFFKSCISRTKNHCHYEEFGDLVGHIKVNGKVLSATKAAKPEKFCFGSFRDHSWDIRRWQTMDQLLILLLEFHAPLTIFGTECWYLDLTLVNMPGNQGGVQRYSTGYVLPRLKDTSGRNHSKGFSMIAGTSILDVPYKTLPDGTREPLNKTVVSMLMRSPDGTKDCLLEVRMSGATRTMCYWPDEGAFQVYEDFLDFEIQVIKEGNANFVVNEDEMRQLKQFGQMVKGFGTRQSGYRIGEFDPTLGGCG